MAVKPGEWVTRNVTGNIIPFQASKNQGDTKKMAPPPKEVEEDSDDEEMSEDEEDESSGEEEVITHNWVLLSVEGREVAKWSLS